MKEAVNIGWSKPQNSQVIMNPESCLLTISCTHVR
jgi:hypothetical protein